MNFIKRFQLFITALLFSIIYSSPVLAASNVSTAIEGSWKDARTQIQTVVDNVVFPALSVVLAIMFFVKLGTAYFDYRKHGQFEFTAPLILFVCLLFTLTAKNYIWSIVP